MDIPCKVFSFLDRMDYAYSIADLVIARSGAAAITEICLFGCSSILIPFPFAIGDHQKYNAKILTERQGAVVIEEKDLTVDSLKETIQERIEHRRSKQDFKEQLQAIVFADAEKRLAEEVMNLS